MSKITVLLIEDHAVVRAGLKMLLSATDNIEIVAEAERGEMAYQLFLETAPDVILMDLSMPGIGGLECIRRIYGRDPSATILVFSVHNQRVYVDRALEAGAKGYMTKSSAPELLVTAIQTLASGGRYLDPNISTPISTLGHYPSINENYQALIDSLSPKEFDVFCLLAKGLSSHKIADELCLGYKTVANYATQIKNKLNTATLAELAHIATILGIIRNQA